MNIISKSIKTETLNCYGFSIMNNISKKCEKIYDIVYRRESELNNFTLFP